MIIETTMSDTRYSNFVRPSSPEAVVQPLRPLLSGEDAKRIYLDEIQAAGSPLINNRQAQTVCSTRKNTKPRLENVSKKDLFFSAQNNDIITLKQILDVCPDMLNTTDDYGWSLLMIACQANSVDAVTELMKRGIDTSVRDKAGNSATSLVIKNRNLVLADVLLSYKTSEPKTKTTTENEQIKHHRKQTKHTKSNSERYFCEVCKKEFPDKEAHLSSTVHNIDASRGKKIPSSYVIPSSNKGYQIMLKVGWDKESGLGPDGSGKKYPIKTVQKQDRKGLGLDKRKRKIQEENQDMINVNKKLLGKESKSSRSMEINFRREFY